MPSRTKANVSGDIGELDVIRYFLEIGASVNSLAQSDYGWDAHVHTPEEALERGNLPGKGWKMSGLTAHVQVKNSESGKAAKVKVGSLRAWLAGSITGTPTFYFFVHKGQPRYASPRMLRSYLSDFDPVTGDDHLTYIGSRKTKAVDFRFFSHLFRLWTKHPRVLINEHVPVDEWPFMKPHQLRGQHMGFVSHVYLAWFTSNFPGHTVPPKGLYNLPGIELSSAAWEVLSGGDIGGSEEEMHQASANFIEFHSGVLDSLVEAAHRSAEIMQQKVPAWQEPPWITMERKHQAPSWPKASLATSYALSTDMKASAEEAKTLIRDVMEFYLLCLKFSSDKTKKKAANAFP